MPKFSKYSIDRLEGCDPLIQQVLDRVIHMYDCRVLWGHRSNVTQERMFFDGHSQKRGGKSLHNKFPSMAVDVAPYPIDWQDGKRFVYFAGHVMAMANILGVRLRWGGDWNMDHRLKDNRFNDYCHFEIPLIN